MIDLNKLEKLAKGASPGPWGIAETRADNGEYTGLEIFADDGSALISEEYLPNDADSQFIAAANPAVILELIETQRELLEAAKAVKSAMKYGTGFDSKTEFWTAIDLLSSAIQKATGE